MKQDVRTGDRQRYATKIAGLWRGLSEAVMELERIAADPVARLSDSDELDALPRLQYTLHAASEVVAGIAPPAGSRSSRAPCFAAGRNLGCAALVPPLGMRKNEGAPEGSERSAPKELPRPTAQFRRRAWLEFQRALDPLARPKPFRIPPRSSDGYGAGRTCAIVRRPNARC